MQECGNRYFRRTRFHPGALVTVRAFDLLGLARDKIICVTMPCFGTTDRTYHNACYLTKSWVLPFWR